MRCQRSIGWRSGKNRPSWPLSNEWCHLPFQKSPKGGWPSIQQCGKTWVVVLGSLGAQGRVLWVDSLGWGAKGFLGTKVAGAEGFFGGKVGWQRLECSQWVRRCRHKMIGRSEASWGYSWWWGQVLHLKRWDQGDSRSFVTRNVQKTPGDF